MDIIYGPVHSLRFGSTLGINLLGPVKACSYNCVYCHLGPTEITMNKIRKDYAFTDLEQMRLAFREYLKQSVTVDALVVSGNGEPTLHPQFDDAMRSLVELRAEHFSGKKIIVLTNGAHFDSKKVIAGMGLADERVVKIDAGNEPIMARINDPLVRINMSKILSGIRKLKDCIVQSLFVDGDISNVSSDIIDEWIEVVGMAQPKQVQICTMTRPGFSKAVRAVSEDVLDGIAFKLKKRTGLECEVFAVQNR